MRLNDIGSWSDVGALHLTTPAAEIPPALKAESEILIPILGRTLEAARTLNGLHQLNGALINSFDMLDFGAAICDRTGRILVANEEFRYMAADRDGLTDIGGVAGATYSRDRNALATALMTAPDPNASPDRQICRLSRKSGRLPLIARTVPIAGRNLHRNSAPLTLLLVVDPESSDRVGAEGIGALGILTTAELEVCQMIVKGHTTSEIGSVRETSVQTVTYQVKSALSKLSCATRLDIVRRAMATRPPGRG
jgi:DNA-binding CsgD family transcriptional regulator